MSKTKYPYQHAIRVAADLVDRLSQACERIAIAGSLRRRCEQVSDIELVYIPRVEERPADWFTTYEVDIADAVITDLLERGTLEARANARGCVTWGPKNKLALHVETGIPVDLFATIEESWNNYLVCRTGPKESNMQIALAAQARGYKWRPYSFGFQCMRSGSMVCMHSEREVFEFVDLPYKPPHER